MDKLEEFLMCRRRHLQLSLTQHKFKFKGSDLSLKGKLREVSRMLRKYREVGLDKMIEKEKFSFSMVKTQKDKKVKELTSSWNHGKGTK